MCPHPFPHNPEGGAPCGPNQTIQRGHDDVLQGFVTIPNRPGRLRLGQCIVLHDKTGGCGIFDSKGGRSSSCRQQWRMRCAWCASADQLRYSSRGIHTGAGRRSAPVYSHNVGLDMATLVTTLDLVRRMRVKNNHFEGLHDLVLMSFKTRNSFTA